jgi:hypothetical protein
MPNLNQPAKNSKDWDQPLNSNFSDIESELNRGKRVYGFFAPHEKSQPSMAVRIEAGYALGPNGLAEVNAQDAGPVAAPSSNDRRDRIVIDRETRAVRVLTGSEGTNPAAPSFDYTEIPLANVLLSPGQTEITDSDITDERTIVPDGDPIKLEVDGTREPSWKLSVDTGSQTLEITTS